jgi:pyruvate dehydrogenase E2 component (dihydrolipoamide acetyltransferase)
MSIVEVKVPDIGDFDSVSVIELMVKVGDTIKVDQSLITVESDKASMEIPSSHAGVIKELKVKLGDKVKEGVVLAMVESSEASASTAVAAPAPAPAPQSTVPAAGASAAVVPSAAVATSLELLVPDIGDFKDVAVIEVMVKVGDTVKAEQSLITVESDKASMEIPSSHAGVIESLKVKVGDKVNQGDLLGMIKGLAQGPVAVPAAAASPSSVSSVPAPAAPQVATASATTPGLSASAHQPTQSASALAKVPHASPSIRKLAREFGIPLERVTGTGPKGRIGVEDLHAYSKSVMSVQASASSAVTAQGGDSGAALGLLPWPKVDFAKFGEVERKTLGRIKKISGANLHRNWVMIPHVTNHDDADITELEAFRVQTNKENEKAGVKVTMLAFLIKACVSALQKFPDFNSSLDGEELVYKKYFHIGFAADTPNGLMVPVIKDADQKGVLQISKEMGELAKKAREGKLSPAEMTGACFTISSLGGIGGRYFTPIINAPEVAILGVCKSQTEPVWDGKQFVPRLMLPLSLSWDHRVIDGAMAARFNAHLAAILADFRRVLL